VALRQGSADHRRPAPSKPRERYLTKEERDKLLEHIETPHVRLFVTLALATGARMGAILDLTWDRVDFAHGTIDFMPAGRDKTNKRRTVVPMNPGCGRRWRRPQGRSDRSCDRIWGKARRERQEGHCGRSSAFGVPCSPHVFRHTAAVWMAQADVPMQKIAQFSGTRQRGSRSHLCPLFAPVHGRRGGGFGLVVVHGSSRRPSETVT
jgi:integrase